MAEETTGTPERMTEERRIRVADQSLPADSKQKLNLLKDKFKNIATAAPSAAVAAVEAQEKSHVDSIVERGKEKEEYYGSIARDRAEEKARKKENSERTKQTTVRMSLGYFSLFNRLKGRGLQFDRTLTYEIAMKYSLDMLDKMDDSSIAEIIDRYKDQA